jgi:hypothetical protein
MSWIDNIKLFVGKIMCKFGWHSYCYLGYCQNEPQVCFFCDKIKK